MCGDGCVFNYRSRESWVLSQCLHACSQERPSRVEVNRCLQRIIAVVVSTLRLPWAWGTHWVRRNQRGRARMGDGRGDTVEVVSAAEEARRLHHPYTLTVFIFTIALLCSPPLPRHRSRSWQIIRSCRASCTEVVCTQLRCDFHDPCSRQQSYPLSFMQLPTTIVSSESRKRLRSLSNSV